MRHRVLTAIVALALLLPGSAIAGWKGANLTWQYYAFGGPFDGGGSPGQCTVGKRTDCGTFFGYFRIVAQPNAILFDYINRGRWTGSDLSLAPTIHNGIAINLDSAGTITAVTIDPETNLDGFDASRISFTPKQIQVDWQDLRFGRKTRVKLHVEVSREPSSGRLTDTPPRL